MEALGPIHWKAALYEALPEAQGRTKHGCRWPTPREMLANDQQWPATKQTIPFKSGVTRELEIKTITWRVLVRHRWSEGRASGPGA